MPDSYLTRVVEPYMHEKNLSQLTLLIGQAPCNKISKVNSALLARNIKSAFIPKRVTNLLQPADVAWMRPLKNLYHKKWNDWLLNAPKSFTAAGNLKSVGYGIAIEWISEIWEDFDRDIIYIKRI